jgi:hypothetical protein
MLETAFGNAGKSAAEALKVKQHPMTIIMSRSMVNFFLRE